MDDETHPFMNVGLMLRPDEKVRQSKEKTGDGANIKKWSSGVREMQVLLLSVATPQYPHDKVQLIPRQSLSSSQEPRRLLVGI